MTTINGGSGADIITGTNGGELAQTSYSQPAYPLAFSPDGGQLAFESQALELAPPNPFQLDDGYNVFQQSMLTGAVSLIAVNATGGSYSLDGTKFALTSPDNLTDDDTNFWPDAYFADVATGALTLVSSANGVAGNGFSTLPVFSPDGSKVLFFSDSTNLVTGDTNGIFDLFLKDLDTGEITRVNTAVPAARRFSSRTDRTPSVKRSSHRMGPESCSTAMPSTWSRATPTAPRTSSSRTWPPGSPPGSTRPQRGPSPRGRGNSPATRSSRRTGLRSRSEPTPPIWRPVTRTGLPTSTSRTSSPAR